MQTAKELTRKLGLRQAPTVEPVIINRNLLDLLEQLRLTLSPEKNLSQTEVM
jgi:hypothetical protein